MAPDLQLTLALRDERELVSLVGAGAAGPRGRYGVVGLPMAVQTLEPGRDVIAQAVDSRPNGIMRVLLLGYELGMPEVALPPRDPPRGQPAGLCIDLAGAAVVDHRTQTMSFVGPDANACAHLREKSSESVQCSRDRAGQIELQSQVDDREHGRRVEAIRELIAAGEIYQANLTRRLRAKGELWPAQALASLSSANPVAHGAYIRLRNLEVLSNSMETLLTYDPASRSASSLPIKGTRARSPSDGSADDESAQRLASDPKEQAEHVMIVDLVRNDLGKVATPGTVAVPELMGVKGYRGVWHGVSTVAATLAPSRTPGELMAAVFPGGSITGAPKRRAMQIISEIEGEPRGMYTGSIVCIMPDGSLHASILIRTLVKDDGGWNLSVGGGIVVDSTPAREVEETWEKVQVFRDLLERRGRRPP